MQNLSQQMSQIFQPFDPLNEDAKNNLVFAKRLAIDNIEALPKALINNVYICVLMSI